MFLRLRPFLTSVRPCVTSLCRSLSSRTPLSASMDLQEVVILLEKLAPPSLAASWDNVGLLLAPASPLRVRSALLAVDLTEDVLREAIELPAQLLICYHPPIFHPLRRLTPADWKGRILTGALENCIAVYSPHTALDAVPGGVNDWLAEGLGECTTRPLTESVSDSFPSATSHRLEVTIPEGFNSETVLTRLREQEGVWVPAETPRAGCRLSLTCVHSGLVGAIRIIGAYRELRQSLELTRLEKPPLPDTGMGRLCQLQTPTPIKTLVQRVKQHLGVPHLRLALGSGQSLESLVSTVAVCAGAGGSILEGVHADLYLTGREGRGAGQRRRNVPPPDPECRLTGTLRPPGRALYL
ncbi:NIF3-like protein 1 isoform X2 [Mobula birostris]|uniref:NIF3-like protein 1 isoform X2 n=1 Tax=Mobula birostris TaxID=1983395 RepID=UPI003B27F0A5